MLRVDVFYLVIDYAFTQTLEKVLSEQERERARAMVFDQTRAQFIFGRALVRSLLAARLSIDARDVPIQLSKTGKPWLGGESSKPLAFSLAHSGELVACSIAQCETLGIDVEAYRTLKNRDGLADRIFSQEERKLFEMVDSSIKQAFFFQSWASKEALLKADGSGFTQPARAYRVLQSHQLAGGLPTSRLADIARGFRLHPLFPMAGYVGALAVPERYLADIHTHFLSARQVMLDVSD